MLNRWLENEPKVTLVCAVTSVVALVLSITGALKGLLPFDIAWIAIALCGVPILVGAFRGVVFEHDIKADLLVSLALIASVATGEFFAAGEVALIMQIGSLLEDYTSGKAREGIEKLIRISPQTARVLRGGKVVEIPVEEVKVGDVLSVLAGETVPVDGTILEGETSIDQSVMTGESIPVDKTAGDAVSSGTINQFGTFTMRADSVSADSSLQRMVRLAEEAEENKAPIVTAADRWATWLVVIALSCAVVTWIAMGEFMRAVTVLVVFCPCALVLATPTAIMAAIGQATKHGVIIKSGEALEKMGRVDTIAFDKTGTLTYGRLEVSDVISFDERLDENALLSMVASAEAKSEHPLGKAIVACAKERKVPVLESDTFKMTAGKGIYAEISGKKLLCGNEKFLEENGVVLTGEIGAVVEKLRTQGKASVLAAESGKCIGVLAMSDVLRPEAKGMVERLHRMNTNIVLLTGDNKKTADYFAGQVGIKQVRAQLLPEEKVSSITAIQEAGKAVCMIGDGVNDAPALKTANVGVAMGGLGSDIAVDAADIVLMSDDISKLPYLKRLSNATVRTIKFSIGLSMCINILAVALSVKGVLNPTTGALVHNAGSCFVVLIAALLYDRKFE